MDRTQNGLSFRGLSHADILQSRVGSGNPNERHVLTTARLPNSLSLLCLHPVSTHSAHLGDRSYEMVLLSILLATRSIFRSAVCLTQAQESSDKLPRAPLPRWEKIEARGLPSRPHCSICMKAHVRDETKQILSSRGLEQCLDIAGALQTLAEEERERGMAGALGFTVAEEPVQPTGGEEVQLISRNFLQKRFLDPH